MVTSVHGVEDWQHITDLYMYSSCRGLCQGISIGSENQPLQNSLIPHKFKINFVFLKKKILVTTETETQLFLIYFMCLQCWKTGYEQNQ